MSAYWGPYGAAYMYPHRYPHDSAHVSSHWNAHKPADYAADYRSHEYADSWSNCCAFRNSHFHPDQFSFCWSHSAHGKAYQPAHHWADRTAHWPAYAANEYAKWPAYL